MKLKTFGDGYSKDTSLYVGIDQSYSGFAITVLGADKSYKTTVAKSEEGGIARLAEIQDHLVSTLVEASSVGKIKDISMEGYAYGSQMANMLGELGGAVKLALFRMKVLGDARYPLIIPPTTLKKYISGKGTGVQKSQILLSVYKKWKVEFPDDNAADSYGLAHFVSGLGTADYEKELYAKFNTAEYREK